MPTAVKPRDKRMLMVISHTHWDREWYLAYQSFRVRLVGLFDELIELFDENPDYKHFMLDGHTIPIEDYLEIRPERADDIERLVRNGQLLIGPWYIIPDEFLPGGEALIRNFLRGHRVAKLFGPVMNVGYIPDPFGQIAHMPAILRGFGIQYATMWRGADNSLKTTEFLWRSPDGSEVLTIHTPLGYGAGSTLPVSPKPLEKRIQTLRDALEPLATTPYVLIMNGGDHLPPQPDLPAALDAANDRLNDAFLKHSSLPEVFEAVDRSIGEKRDGVAVHRGEFRSGERAHLLPGVISARMWIKQENQACEDLLAHWAEPFSTWAESLKRDIGGEWKQPLPITTAHMPFPSDEASIAALIDRGWRHLLENQPHDSICGCSVDGVHEEMRQRYRWVRDIAEEIVRQSLRTIAALGPDHPLGTIAVFNPTPQLATQHVTVTVPWASEHPIVAVTGPAGERIEVAQTGATHEVVIPAGVVTAFEPTRKDIGFVAADVPGYGYKIYRLEAGMPDEARVAQQHERSSVENDFFVVEVAPGNGTLTVTDKRTGRALSGLNRFVDGGDRGDEYNFCEPERDSLIDSPHGPASVNVTECAGSRWLTVDMTYRLPARLSADRSSRSEEWCDGRIVSTITLTDGVPRIDISTTVHNVVEDHRVRAYFPSGVRTNVSKADEHFGVIERPLELPKWDRETWFEQPLGTHPHKAFVSVDDGNFGLTIANRGLPEYEVLDEPDGATIALTLLRCVGWLSRDDLSSRRGGAGPPLRTPGAQMPGRQTLEYSIIPHAGDWASANAHVAAVQFVRPARARWQNHGIGHIGPSGSLLDVDSPAFQVTAIKRAEDGDGVIVRLYNTLDEPAQATVDLTPYSGPASLVNLNEEHIIDVPRIGQRVPISARPNEIVTLRFRRDGT